MVGGRDTVHHLLYGDISYRHLGRLSGFRGNRLAVTFHQPPGNISQRYLRTGDLRRIDAIIVVGSSQLPIFEVQTDRNRLHRIPLGVDTAYFGPPQTEKTASLPLTCLFVGSHYRDLATARRVMEMALAQRIPVRFEALTDPSNVSNFDDLPNVRCHVRIPEQELLSLYHRADVLIEPLSDSTANSAVLEGLACGLPLIVTDVGSIRDYVDEEVAFMTPPEDAEAIIEALSTLAEDPGTRRRMGLQSRRRALQFDWHEVAAQVRGVYRQLAGLPAIAQ